MKSKSTWIISWAVIRLPLFGLLGYLFRYQLIAIFEKTIGFTGRMDFFVFTISTFYARFLLYVFFSLTLIAGYLLIQKIKVSPIRQYGIWLASTLCGLFFSFYLIFQSPNAFLRTFFVFALLAINTIPIEWLENSFNNTNLLFLVGIGISETIFPQTYTLSLINQAPKLSNAKKWTWGMGILIVSLIWMFLLVPYDSQRIFTLAEKIHADPAVQKFSTGIYNWVELNPEKNLLYAVGRGTNFLLAFDLNHLDQAPKRSRQDIGKTQSFGFNPDQQEIYVYKADTRELLYMDASSLKVLRSVPIPDLAPGDVWIKWVYFTDSIIISSEADAEIGIPLYVVDRKSEKIIASMEFPTIPTAYLIVNPNQPLMYFNSFKDSYFAVWNMDSYEITNQVEITPRTDRMVFSERTQEVWIASPLDGSVLRYDADTLKNTGAIKSNFGDRTLNIDYQRNLLLTGNFINGRLTIIDVTTQKKVASYYLGPWIRTIALDIPNGIAYVSTVRGLFKINYSQGLNTAN
ncbi:MAG: hypothetical protein U0X74_04700 [Anaerolineales bacterium]